MFNSKVSIESLIAIVSQGGRVKTGIDVYNSKGVLLLEKNILVSSVKILEVIRDQGIKHLPVNPDNHGGIWDSDGNYIVDSDKLELTRQSEKSSLHKSSLNKDDLHKKDKNIKKNLSIYHSDEIEKRLKEIEEIKIEAAKQYDIAKQCIKTTIDEIRRSGGEFDYDKVEESVSDLIAFFSITDNPFAYLTKEILNHDDFLYSHSINVCAIGTAVVNRFNMSFSSMINKHIDAAASGDELGAGASAMPSGSYTCYFKDDIIDIAAGFFLHDIGKILIPNEVLNKKSMLTKMEFEMIKNHSYALGVQILEKCRLKNRTVENIVKLHHAALFREEEHCYPLNINPDDIPFSVKICKLADMYDAMTSKRSYREALNPINVVTDLFRKYAKKDKMLQFILHAFVKSVGIYPIGSVIYLKNGQMAYVLESIGPLVLPFTDADGKTLTANESPHPINIGCPDISDKLKADNFKSIKTTLEVYKLLPQWLKPNNSFNL